MSEKEKTKTSLEIFIAQELGLERINRISEDDLEKEDPFLFRFYNHWGHPEKIMEKKDEHFNLSLQRYIFKDNNKNVFSRDIYEIIQKYYKNIEGIVFKNGSIDEALGFFSTQIKSVDSRSLLFIEINSVKAFYFITIISFSSPFALPS